MTRYIVRRFLVSLPVLFGVLFAVFAIARVIPGSPCAAALGERTSPARCAAFNERHGLDKSVPEQFVIYLGELAQGGYHQHVIRRAVQESASVWRHMWDGWHPGE